MRRLFFPLAVAAALHLFVFSLDINYSPKGPQSAGMARQVSVRLSHGRKPEQTAVADSAQGIGPQELIAPEQPPNKIASPPTAPVSDDAGDRQPPAEIAAVRPTEVVTPGLEEMGEPRSVRVVPATEKSEVSAWDAGFEKNAGEGGVKPALAAGTVDDIGDAAVAVAGGVDEEARPLYRSNPVPHYPGLARKRGYEGRVLLDVLVADNGTAAAIRLVESSGYAILDRAAMTAVRDWLFAPGLKGGRKVEMWVRVPVRFELGL